MDGNATDDGSAAARYGSTMEQSLLSFAIFTVCMIPLLIGYSRIRETPSAITLAPMWTDFGIVFSAYLLSVCLAGHSFVLPEDCGVYAGVVYVAGTMFIAAFFTKGLQAYFQCRKVRYPPSPRQKRGCMTRGLDMVGGLYLNDWYTFVLWSATTFVVVAVCTTVWKDIVQDGQSCLLAPSADFAVEVFAGIAALMVFIVVLHASLGIVHPVLGLWMFQCACYLTFLSVALVAYVNHWVHLEGLTWDPAYFFASLYLDSMLTTFIVPIWVHSHGTRYRIWIKIKQRTGMVVQALCCCLSHHARLGLDDEEEYVHFPSATDADITQRMLDRTASASPTHTPATVPLPSTQVVETETMPREIAEYLSKALVFKYGTQNVPIPTQEIKASDIVNATFVLLHAEKVAAATGARRYYTLLQHTLRMLSYSRAEHIQFGEALREIAGYVRENHITLPQAVIAALAPVTRESEEIYTDEARLTSAEPTPDSAAAMQRPILPLLKFLTLVMQRCIRYVDMAVAEMRDEDREAGGWYAKVVRGEDVELTRLERTVVDPDGNDAL